MDVMFVALRLIHIGAGVFWVGAGLLMLFFVAPTVRLLGAEGRVFIQGFERHSHYEQAMAVSSLLTTVSGVLLFAQVSGGFSSGWLLSTQGLVLSVGAVAGILAFLVGVFVIGPTTGLINRLSAEMVGGGAPSQHDASQMQQLQARAQRAREFAIALMVLAVAGMSLARYL